MKKEDDEFEKRRVFWLRPGEGLMFPQYVKFEWEVYRVSLTEDGCLVGHVWRGGKWVPAPFVEAEFKGSGLSEEEAKALTTG